MLTDSIARTDKNRIFLLGLITLITLHPFFEIGATTADDLFFYFISYENNLWSLFAEWGRQGGRFYIGLVQPFYCFPYFGHNHTLTKIIQYSSLIFTFVAFSAVITKAFRSRDLGILSMIILLATLSLSKWSSIIVCYPLYFCLSFGLLLCSVLLLLSHLENGKKKYLIASALTYFAGLVFYEAYLVYLLIVAVIVAGHHLRENRGVLPYREIFLTFLPFVSVGLIYLIVYFSFYLAYPTTYDGNTFASDLKLTHITTVLKNYSKSAFPLNTFYDSRDILSYQSDLPNGHSNDLLYILRNAQVEWLIKAALICLLFVQTIKLLPKLGFRAVIGGSIAAIILIYLSHICLAITKKYAIDYPYILGYVPTFFSFLGVVLLITLLFAFFYSFASRHRFLKILYVGTLTVYIFDCSIRTSYSNHYIAKDMAQGKLAFDMIKDFSQWEGFSRIPDGSIIYAEDLYKNSSMQLVLFNQGFDWGTYLHLENGKNIFMPYNMESYRRTRKEHPDARVYLMKKKEAHKSKEGFLIFAPLDSTQAYEPGTAPVSLATILYHSPYKEFSLSFRIKKNSPSALPVTIGSFKDSISESYYTANISSKRKNESSTIITVSATGIDPGSIMISDILFSGKSLVEIE